MWQPRAGQKLIIWTVALLLVLAWPASSGSLGVKLVRWLADPLYALPEAPGPLPFGLYDNGDAVAEHDALLSEYYRRYNESGLTRWRMSLKDAADPFDPSTERQILVGVGVLSALWVWMLERSDAG